MKKFFKGLGYIFLVLFIMGVIGNIISPEEVADEETKVELEKTKEEETNKAEVETKEEVKQEKEVDVSENVRADLDRIYEKTQASIRSTGEAYGTLSELLIMAGNDINLINNQEWRLAVIEQMSILKLSSKTFQELNIESEYQEINDVVALFNNLGHQVEGSVDAIAEGIDNQDEQLIIRGGQLINDSNKTTDLIIEKFDEIKTKYGL